MALHHNFDALYLLIRVLSGIMFSENSHVETILRNASPLPFRAAENERVTDRVLRGSGGFAVIR